MKLTKKQNAIVLEVSLPKQAIVTHDKEKAVTIPASESPKIIMRDHEQDGIINDSMVPGKPPPGASLTKDGYMKFEPTAEYQGIFLQWMVGIGLSINHFLHGIDSAYPRE